MAIANPVLTDKDLNRLWSKVVKGPNENDCWSWTGALSQAGYAYLHIGGRKGKRFLVHRILYELLIGPIPENKELHHLCENPYCVRPDHQEPVSRHDHLLKGKTIIAHSAAVTHCPRGHPYDMFNTRFYRNWRVCRTCSNIRRFRRRRRIEEVIGNEPNC